MVTPAGGGEELGSYCLEVQQDFWLFRMTRVLQTGGGDGSILQMLWEHRTAEPLCCVNSLFALILNCYSQTLAMGGTKMLDSDRREGWGDGWVDRHTWVQILTPILGNSSQFSGSGNLTPSLGLCGHPQACHAHTHNKLSSHIYIKVK